MSDQSIPISDDELMAQAVRERVRKEASSRGKGPGRIVNRTGGGLYKVTKERPAFNRRKHYGPLDPQEQEFVTKMLSVTKMDPEIAGQQVGLKPGRGRAMMRRRKVARALKGELTHIAQRTGVELDKDRLLLELDHALVEANQAFNRRIRVGVECGACHSHNIICKNCQAAVASVEVRVGPREVAALATATSRVTETAAKIVGAMAPLEQHHKHTYETQGSYAEILRMVRERPAMFTPAQLKQIRETASGERSEIESLLQHLDELVPQIRH